MPKPPAAKRQKQKSLSTDEITSQLESKPQLPLITRQDENIKVVYSLFETELKDKLVANSTDKCAWPLLAQDINILGEILFIDILVGAQDRVVTAIKEQLQKDHLMPVIRSASIVSQQVDKLEKSGQNDIAKFMTHWAMAIESDRRSQRTVAFTVRATRERYNLVKQWISMVELTVEQRSAMSALFEAQHINTDKEWTTQLVQFFQKLLQLPSKRALTDRVYRHKPLKILVDVFGEGILLLIPSSFEKKVQRLSKQGMAKEEKLSAAARAMAHIFPDIKHMCEKALESIVDPTCNHQPLGPNKTIRSIQGSIPKRGAELSRILNDIPILELISTTTPGSSRISGADSDDNMPPPLSLDTTASEPGDESEIGSVSDSDVESGSDEGRIETQEAEESEAG